MTDDLQTIGDDFSVSLQELTFNSKPIITTLTMIAEENTNAAPYITQAVERRIEKAIPEHKLYAIYLLDSISKNVGSPYTLLFGQKLSQTFISTYTSVNEDTRRRMMDLFRTWKVAKTQSGMPLFPEEPINNIEQFLIKASGINQRRTPQQQPAQPQGFPQYQQFQQFQQQQFPQQQFPQQQYPPQHFQPVPQVTPFMLYQTIDRLLNLTTQRLQLTPNDDKIKQKIGIINQLKSIIQSEQMSPDQLVATKGQLDEMTRAEEMHIRNTPPVRSPPLQQAQPVPNLKNILNKVQVPEPKPVTTGQKNFSGLGSLSNLLNVKAPVKTPTPTPPPMSTPTPPGQQKGLSSLLSNLSKSGLIKTSSSSKPTPPTLPSTSLLGSLLAKTTVSKQPTPQPTSSISSELAQYDITAKFLNLDPSAAYTTLFITSKPNKCGTCGKRFSNTQEGQAKSRAHLDWHFRVNKKLKDGQGGMSRNWFLDDVGFVEFRDDEIIGSGDDDKKRKEESFQKDKEQKKERKFVTVPSDGGMTVVCGVCKEQMKAIFDDDSGDWIWDGAVQKNGKVFHDQCYTESTGGLSSLLNLPKKRTRGDEKAVDFSMLNSIVKSVKSNDGSRIASS